MRILYVTPYVPNRIRVRPFQLLQALAQAGHAITLGAVWSEEAEHIDLAYLGGLGIEVIEAHLPPLRSFANSLWALPTERPLQASYSWHAGLAARLAQRALDDPFDVIHVEHLRGACYGRYLRARLAAACCATPIVWDSVDCITHLFRQAADRSASRKGRWITRFEQGRTGRYEPLLLAQFDATLVTSPMDRQALLALAAEMGMYEVEDRLHVLPNGVDLDYFSPDATPRLPATLVFTGKMSYHANVTAAQQLLCEIMPLVWTRRPDAQVWIVGKDPAREVLALANDSRPGSVWVSGTVPDLRPYLREATVAVAPIPYGAGIQNKVLEAMACGTPVVASAQAVSALSVQAGHDLLVAQHPTESAEQILSLLDSPSKRIDLGQAGRAFVERHHTWSRMGDELERLYVKARRTHFATVGKAVAVTAN